MRSNTDLADVIKGALPLAFITLNLAFWALPLTLLALMKLLIPIPAVRNGIYQLMIGIYIAACQVDIFLFENILGIRFEFNIEHELERDKSYLIISNHQSWADILVYQSILIHRTPLIKFIVKKELLFLPLVGLICWAYEYPMVYRQSFKNSISAKKGRKKDLDILKNKLGGISQHPASIINFAEGTRFNREKHDKYKSPHKHLLKVRSGGLFYILDSFGSRIDDILDVTISYSCREPVFFKFLGGKEKVVQVHARKIPLNELLPELSDPKGKLAFNKVDAWLKKIWLEKDHQLELMSPN